MNLATIKRSTPSQILAFVPKADDVEKFLHVISASKVALLLIFRQESITIFVEIGVPHGVSTA